jgi:hypothetical protein
VRFLDRPAKVVAFGERRIHGSPMPKVLNIKTIGRKAAIAMIRSGTAVYIGRKTGFGTWPQSEWANPFSVKRYGRDGAIKRFRQSCPSG